MGHVAQEIPQSVIKELVGPLVASDREAPDPAGWQAKRELPPS